ncbi:D-alanyl-D-alanine carboxypeptidase/D-alanyl-D-alanine-endopeptidase [Caenimonas koreensis DSM 17982]|uniref:D-alanyl-D-alanine carboxypeptidase/D-alanyl-D-alanine-endopeptidase n=1 Tax=Caenimonas koreensis DSM 17982 TaxID=1121255 RepID=A0A844B1V5_9BURK|nr:D-alanyl-D-alanine carboxypeptidase/D-alanyl-D-alanine-endopeptidase [Caenimonas koreensis]MRD48708.1 D-alanyl-D-alanine carboxypeptidase/D-alanyl-D-alanine-endopeptidase [Caenimonas koreensis DSM 17982]
MHLRPAAVSIALALAALSLSAQTLPPDIEAAFVRTRLPRDAVSLLVVDADGKSPPRLVHRPGQPMNPASVAKLLTTYAGLDLLGPAFTWSTPVFIDGTVRDGTLQGDLYIKGQGDPKLVVENLWLLLRRVQGLGIRTINGDIVLDHTAFEVPPQDPGAFDGEPLRPYNASPDALLINFKSVMMTFTPRDAQVSVHVEPPLSGVQVPTSVPLGKGDCGDWRAGLRADFSDASRVRFAGIYPATCGERMWPVAAADPAGYAARAVAGMWQQLGGSFTGRVRDGRVPAALAPAFEVTSPALSELVRDVNKYSNNVMAQQMFLTLSLKRRGTGSFAGSREIVRQWWRERIGGEPPSLDNGSGLSREERITAQQLALLLQSAWASPVMPELMSSLPVSGVDGTMRRARGKAVGVAHLKTGSLRDVTAVAGYVHAVSGRRYVLVAIANHPQAASLRPMIETLIEWTAADQ